MITISQSLCAWEVQSLVVVQHKSEMHSSWMALVEQFRRPGIGNKDMLCHEQEQNSTTCRRERVFKSHIELVKLFPSSKVLLNLQCFHSLDHPSMHSMSPGTVDS